MATETPDKHGNIQMKITPVIIKDRSGVMFTRFDDEVAIVVLMSNTGDGFEISVPSGHAMSINVLSASEVDILDIP